MPRILTRLIAAHYRYWVHMGKGDMSYFSALVTHTLILFMLKCALFAALIGLPFPLFIFAKYLPGWIGFLVMLLGEAPLLYLLLRFCFPGKRVIEEEKTLTKTQYYVYNTMCIVMLIVSAIVVYITAKYMHARFY